MTHDELLNAVHYDPDTGVFTRKRAAGNSTLGAPVGCLDRKGYMKASVLGELVKLHRLAWFYVHGFWPTYEIDHKNRIKSDNRISNLRDCDTSTNCTNQVGARTNNKLGIQGVHRIQKTGRFRAVCTAGKQRVHLGVFTTAEEASAAYWAFKNPLLPNNP